jgi:hypothetical protein
MMIVMLMLSDWLAFMGELYLIGVQVQRQGPGGAAEEDEHALHPERPEPPHLLRVRRLLPSVGATATPPERHRRNAATALPPEHSWRHTRQLYSSSTPAATASATGTVYLGPKYLNLIFFIFDKTRSPWEKYLCNFLIFHLFLRFSHKIFKHYLCNGFKR